MLINKEGLAVKSSLDSSVTAQVRFTITMYCFYYVPLLLLMVFFPPRAPYLFILQHWLSKHAKLIILSLQQKTSWKYVSYRLFFSILGWYPTLRNEPKLRYNRWIRLMNCFICGLPPEDTKSLWHLMTILYWLSCKIPHLIIEAEINSKFKQFCWHWHTV